VTRTEAASRPTRRFRLLRFAGTGALLSTFAISFAACSANKNYEERQRYAEQNRDRFPDTSRCIDTCTPDPGPSPVDCAQAEAGIEFMSPPIFTFELNEASGAARNLYSYTDGSEDFFEPDGYQPPVAPIDRCAGVEGNHALNVRGGLLRGWGGGMGTSLHNFANSVSLPACADEPESEACYVQEVEPLQGAMGIRQVNASAWDGISFWARRGPGSQAELRVLAGDKYTDDDLNVNNGYVQREGEYQYCKIVRTCDCQNHKPCTTYEYQASANADPEIRSRCFDPEVDGFPSAEFEQTDSGDVGTETFGGLYERCGDFRCEESHPTGDPAPLIQGTSCTPYTYQTGETRDVCYNPGESPTPGEAHEVCGDFWTRTVILGLEWQFYMVPFSAMRQQGFGKEAPKLLTDQLSVVRFTWDGGWIDYWIDDVRFYRVAR
jgi:hypothetical protein